MRTRSPMPEPVGLPMPEPTAPTLFDREAGIEAREAALGNVEDHADPSWLVLAFAAVMECARSLELFTTDDVWRILDERKVGPPPEPRAMGAVMNRAKHECVAQPTPQFVTTERKSAHASPIRVWRSNDPRSWKVTGDGR